MHTIGAHSRCNNLTSLIYLLILDIDVEEQRISRVKINSPLGSSLELKYPGDLASSRIWSLLLESNKLLMFLDERETLLKDKNIKNKTIKLYCNTF